MSAKIGTLEEALRYAKAVAEYENEDIARLSDNERRIVVLAREVERLQKTQRSTGGGR